MKHFFAVKRLETEGESCTWCLSGYAHVDELISTRGDGEVEVELRIKQKTNQGKTAARMCFVISEQSTLLSLITTYLNTHSARTAKLQKFSSPHHPLGDG